MTKRSYVVLGCKGEARAIIHAIKSSLHEQIVWIKPSTYLKNEILLDDIHANEFNVNQLTDHEYIEDDICKLHSKTVIFIFQLFWFKTVLGPLLGPFWGPLGKAFWLKSRLQIGQDGIRRDSDNFFSLLGPVPTTFFRSRSPSGGSLEGKWEGK